MEADGDSTAYAYPADHYGNPDPSEVPASLKVDREEGGWVAVENRPGMSGYHEPSSVRSFHTVVGALDAVEEMAVGVDL